jgi:hypothetical protein
MLGVFYMSTISQVTLCIHDNYQINIFQFSLVKVATEANIIMFQYLDSLEVWKLGHTTKEQMILHSHHACIIGGRVIVFNATFNNISVISWQSILLVEKTVTEISTETLHTCISIDFEIY